MPHTGHTPGPWIVQQEFDNEPGYVIGPDNSDICTIEPPLNERQANITLIAAAPEMLVALQLTADTLDLFTEKHLKEAGMDCVLEKVKTAIAHAEGRG